jgi:hypothetical protein
LELERAESFLILSTLLESAEFSRGLMADLL